MSAVTLNAALATKVTAKVTATRRSGKTVATRATARVASFASSSASSASRGFAVSTREDGRRRATPRKASAEAFGAMKKRGENIVTGAAAARWVRVVASRRFRVDCRARANSRQPGFFAPKEECHVVMCSRNFFLRSFIHSFIIDDDDDGVRLNERHDGCRGGG